MEHKGFNQDGEKIEGFSAKCLKCGSENVEVQYKFRYYGGMTGWDVSLAIQCNDCENRAVLDV